MNICAMFVKNFCCMKEIIAFGKFLICSKENIFMTKCASPVEILKDHLKQS